MASTEGQSTAPIVTIAEGRATIRLNRPREHNRIEPDDLAVLRETLTRIDDDPGVRVLVLTGTGKSFSSGYHIGALVERHAQKRDGEEPGSDAFERTVDRLEALRVPTIAALNGSVYGGSTDLALAGLKRAINEIAGGRLDRAALATARSRCAASEDHAEALQAWSEKRSPLFRGR